MTIQKFEDIIAWQKAQDLAVDIYAAFEGLKDFGFKNQICQAVVSISNNIAEGFDRSSNADKKDILIEKTNEISRLIYGFIKSLTA